jgi:hypothetical protein
MPLEQNTWLTILNSERDHAAFADVPSAERTGQ